MKYPPFITTPLGPGDNYFSVPAKHDWLQIDYRGLEHNNQRARNSYGEDKLVIHVYGTVGLTKGRKSYAVKSTGQYELIHVLYQTEKKGGTLILPVVQYSHIDLDISSIYVDRNLGNFYWVVTAQLLTEPPEGYAPDLG